MPEIMDVQDMAVGGMLYEPRSLWSIQSVDMSDAPQEVRFNREHFYNGTPYPITITRVAVMGVNYIFQRMVGQIAPWQAATVGSRVAISINAPFRSHFGKFPMVLNGFAPQPTWTPVPRNPVQSSLWGQCMLTPDHPLYLPRGGAMQWDISSFSSYLRDGEEEPPIPEITVHQLYQEEGGFFAGHVRSRSFRTQEIQPLGGHDVFNPADGWPYPWDIYHSPVNYANTPTTFWIPNGSFTAKEFKAQEATRDGSAKIIGLRTMIDQLDVDVDVIQPVAPARVSPLSMRMGTRIRTVSGGSDEWWWREGAPLALVFDTITPATVYKLPFPITLGPHDTLDLTLEVPANAAGDGLPVNIGVSLNGFAAIEG